MEGSGWIGIAALQLAVLTALGTLGAWAAGRLGTARIAGGVLAGLLIGPAVLGGMAPELHGRLFGGATSEQRELREYRAKRAEARQRLEATDVSEVAVREFEAETERRLAELRSAANASAEPYRRASWVVAAVAVGIALLGVGIRAASPAVGPPRPLSAVADPIGLLSLLAPAALAAFVGWVLIRTHWIDLGARDPTVWLAGMALGCGAAAAPPGARLLAWVGGGREAEAPEEADALRQRVRSTAWANAGLSLIGLTVLLLVWADPAEPAALFGGRGHRYLGAIAIAGLVLGALGGWVIRPGPRRATDPEPGWLLPTEGLLFALVGSRLPLVAEFDWLLVLLVLLLVGDCKSLGVMLGAKLFAHRGWLDGMRMGTVLAAGGTVPLAVVLGLRVGGLIEGSLFVALTIGSAITAALSRSMTRMIDRWLTELEPPPDDR